MTYRPDGDDPRDKALFWIFRRRVEEADLEDDDIQQMIEEVKTYKRWGGIIGMTTKLWSRKEKDDE